MFKVYKIPDTSKYASIAINIQKIFEMVVGEGNVIAMTTNNTIMLNFSEGYYLFGDISSIKTYSFNATSIGNTVSLQLLIDEDKKTCVLTKQNMTSGVPTESSAGANSLIMVLIDHGLDYTSVYTASTGTSEYDLWNCCNIPRFGVNVPQTTTDKYYLTNFVFGGKLLEDFYVCPVPRTNLYGSIVDCDGIEFFCIGGQFFYVKASDVDMETA